MTIPSPPDSLEVYIGFGLFVLSEVIGMSKARDNSVLQVLIHMGRELFPYEVKRREPATRSNRPKVRRRRAANGQFTSEDDHADRR
jgi:hypothetical protein